jgi:hypothetical protein
LAESSEKPRPSVWVKLLPALITAVAALLTAIGGIFLGLRQEPQKPSPQPVQTLTPPAPQIGANPSSSNLRAQALEHAGKIWQAMEAADPSGATRGAQAPFYFQNEALLSKEAVFDRMVKLIAVHSEERKKATLRSDRPARYAITKTKLLTSGECRDEYPGTSRMLTDRGFKPEDLIVLLHLRRENVAEAGNKLFMFFYRIEGDQLVWAGLGDE